MPIKMLFWNIQNFSINKIDPAAAAAALARLGKRKPGSEPVPAEYKRDNILATVAEVDPALFVVIEVMSDRGTRGSLLSSGGSQATLTLLEHMRAWLDGNWHVVPPLKLVDRLIKNELDEGQSEVFKENQFTEGISVFYRADLLDFDGPWVWPQTADNTNPAKVAVPFQQGLPTQAYPPPWDDALPEDNHLAGQYDFRLAGSEVWFPDKDSRRPWLTRFVERNVQAPRVFTVVSLHLPPQKDRASRGLTKLSDLFTDTAYPLGNREVLVVGGDINLNTAPVKDKNNISSVDSWTTEAVKNMRAAGFGPPLFRAPPDTITTTYKRAGWASPTAYNMKALDNLFLKFGRDVTPKSAISQLVVDRVAGDPALGLTSDMETDLATILAIPNENERLDEFRLVENYRHMGPNPGTSDHMPILIEL